MTVLQIVSASVYTHTDRLLMFNIPHTNHTVHAGSFIIHQSKMRLLSLVDKLEFLCCDVPRSPRHQNLRLMFAKTGKSGVNIIAF